jgi:hypothetical protein
MSCIEPYGRVVDPAGDPFGMIFPAVYADYYQLTGILQLELPQLREHMNAVDSTVRPEIQKDYFAAQIG